MASNAQVDSLTKRHQELEAEITAELKHPAFDELRVVEMKREKLKIKDQIEGLAEHARLN